MSELFQEMYCGPNVQNLVESDDCKVMRLSDNSGEGMMTLYHVFPGVFLMYNDFHMKECVRVSRQIWTCFVSTTAGKGALSRKSAKMPLAI